MTKYTPNENNNPFDKIDKIYCINLDECTERLSNFNKMSQVYGFEFERFPAIKDIIGSWGCSMSHIQIIKDAKKRKYKQIIIFEDDAIFLYERKYVWNILNSNMDGDYDMLYLGGNFAWENYLNGDTGECSCLGRFGIIIRESSFDWLIENHPTKECFLKNRSVRGDVLYSNSPLLKKILKYPVLAVSSNETYTSTNCAKTIEPVKSGCEHFSLIVSAYFKNKMIDEQNIKRDLIYKLFSEGYDCNKYKNMILPIINKINPFKYIDVFYINLDSDIERRKHMEKLFTNYDIPNKRFPAIKHTIGWGGSTMSHRKIIEIAKKDKMKRVLICEDDIFFMCDKYTAHNTMRKLLGENFSIGYLGTTLLDMAPKIKDDIYKVNKSDGNYCYIVDESIYDELLRLLPLTAEEVSHEKLNVSDNIIRLKIQPNYKCILSPIVSSLDGWSHNWEKQRHTVESKIYNGYLKYIEKNYVNDISVIIPAFNAMKYIEESLDSIEKQNPKEIIVGVDGCEETLKYIIKIKNKYKNLRVFWSKNNIGCYNIRNSLVELSNSTNILFFDADDIMIENTIKMAICELKTHDIVRWKYFKFTDDKKFIPVNNFDKGSFAITKNAWYIMGGFMPWVCSADNEFHLRSNDFLKIKMLDSHFRAHRRHSESLTQREDTGMKSKLRKEYRKLIKEKYETPHIETKLFYLEEIIINELGKIKSYKNSVNKTKQPEIKQQPTPKPTRKLITTQPEKGNIYVISSQETSRQLKTIQDSIKEFNIIEPTPLDFPEVLNLSYLFEQKLKHDKREIAKKKKEISYSITIRNIIKKAKENKFRKVIIFQDGITFDKDPNTIIPQLEELPENFGICFLGGYFRKPFLGSFYDYNEHFLELNGSFKIWGTHAIVIGQEIYDILIKALTINFDKDFQELLCSIIVGKYPSYTYNLPFVFYDEHFSNRYSINNVPVKTLKQDNSNIIKKSKNNK